MDLKSTIEISLMTDGYKGDPINLKNALELKLNELSMNLAVDFSEYVDSLDKNSNRAVNIGHAVVTIEESKGR